MGVQRAMTMVLEKIEQALRPLYTYGSLIHNPQVLEELEQQGIRVLQTIPEKLEGTVVIRTHGVPAEIRHQIIAAGAMVCDATCPKVMRIHSIVERHSRDGDTIVIVGDKGHAEVLGLLGTAGEKGIVVSDPAEVETTAGRLAETISTGMCVVAQTTQSRKLFERIVALFKERLVRVTVYDTICTATVDRQHEVLMLSRKVHVMVIVGGYRSANTTRLAAIAREAGVPTHHIEHAGELERSWFENCEKVGVMAGASTPNWVTGEVVERLSSW
jgi:4-hydroxy-3-methylbut-2-enyl diphosphate reductase